MPVTLSLSGARGGQGTSTTAAALALLAAQRGHRVELVTHDIPTMRALLGMTVDKELDPDGAVEIVSGLLLRRAPSGTATLVVRDRPLCVEAETLSDGSCERRLIVLRGPCYLSLRATIDSRDAMDGLIVVREPGRSVTNRDLVEITGLPVVAETTVTPQVARTIDAGVLATTIGRRPEFHALSAYLETLEPDFAQPDPTARSACHINYSDRVRFDRSHECTDLPVAQSATSRGEVGLFARCRPVGRSRICELNRTPRPKVADLVAFDVTRVRLLTNVIRCDASRIDEWKGVLAFDAVREDDLERVDAMIVAVVARMSESRCEWSWCRAREERFDRVFRGHDPPAKRTCGRSPRVTSS